MPRALQMRTRLARERTRRPRTCRTCTSWSGAATSCAFGTSSVTLPAGVILRPSPRNPQRLAAATTLLRLRRVASSRLFRRCSTLLKCGKRLAK
eukprot:1195122-Prorocentrum_minimum.AAC.10